MAPIIKPFPFENLKNYPASQVEMQRLLLSVLPQKSNVSTLLQGFGQMMRHFLGTDVEGIYESLYVTPFGSYVENLGESFVVASLALTPHPKNFIIELDSRLSRFLVEKILGGGGEVFEPVHFTSLDQGVLKYFLIRCLQQGEDFFQTVQVKPHLKNLYTQKDRLGKLFAVEEKFYLVTFRTKINKHHGFIRIGIPETLAELIAATTGRLQRVNDEAFFDKVGLWKTVVWAEVGRVGLNIDQLASLEKGDVLFLDELYPDFEDGNLKGECLLHLGDEVEKGVSVHLESKEKKVFLSLGKVP